MILNAKNHQEWAAQQHRENVQQKNNDIEEEKNYANQEEAVLRMRGMLEDEQNARKAAFAKEMQRENQRMARDKRDRENAWKNDQESNNQLEVTLTSHNEVLEMNGSIRRTDNWQ